MLTSELTSYVRELGSLADGRFSDADLLSYADQETMVILKEILSAREDYLVESTTVTISTNGFRVPSRAIGGKLRDVVIYYNGEYVSIPRIDLTERPDNPVGYFYKGNRVYWNNVVNQIGGAPAEISYYARPGLLISTASCALVTGTDGSTLYTSGVDPRTLTSIDVVKGTPNFESIYWNQTQAGISGSSATSAVILAAAPNVSGSEIEVGDWLVPSGYSPVPQIPVEFHQVLAQRVVVKTMEALGDDAGFQRAQAKAGEMQKAALNMISLRDDGQPEKLRIDENNPFINNAWR